MTKRPKRMWRWRRETRTGAAVGRGDVGLGPGRPPDDEVAAGEQPRRQVVRAATERECLAYFFRPYCVDVIVSPERACHRAHLGALRITVSG